MNMGIRVLTMAKMLMFLIPWALLFFIIIFFLLFRMIKSSKKQSLIKLPPGPYQWPIVGNLFQIGKNPHISLAEMAQIHGPIISLRLGQRTTIVVSSSAAASEVFKTHNINHVLSGGDATTLVHASPFHNMNLLFSSETGENWRKIRNLYTSNVFSRKALESRAAMREEKVSDMIKYISSKGVENIVSIKEVMLVTGTNIISNTLLSMDVVDFEGNGIGAGIKDSLRRLSSLAVQPQLADLYPIFGRWDPQGWNNKVMQIIEHELGTIWKDIILLKKKNKSNTISSVYLNDFIDVLIEKGCTHTQINALMEELFAAGIESMALTTEWFVAELLRNPEVMQMARDEVMRTMDGNDVVKDSDLIRLPFLQACFKETLRLHPPAPLLLPHKALETCEVMGYTIPKDSQIRVNAWAISRDPNIWDDPLRFKPERFMGSRLSSYKGKEFEYLAFGAGRRMCPGEELASKIILLAMASLILNFDWFMVGNNQDINMDEDWGLPMRKKEMLYVNLKLRLRH